MIYEDVLDGFKETAPDFCEKWASKFHPYLCKVIIFGITSWLLNLHILFLLIKHQLNLFRKTVIAILGEKGLDDDVDKDRWINCVFFALDIGFYG